MTSDWLAVLCVCRHAHRGKLAGDLVRGGVQVLQLPQVQTAAADQPRSQVAPVCEKIPRDIEVLGCYCHTCAHMSVTGRKSCFLADSHALPSSYEPLASRQPQAIHLTLLLSLPGWTAKASSCCFHSSK